MANEILKEEIMNEEQLENVVGGTRGQLSCDTKLLNALGLMDHHYEPYYCQTHMSEVEGEVNAALKTLGRAKNGAKGFFVQASNEGSNNYHYRVGFWKSHNCSRGAMYKMIAEAAGQPDFDYKKFL